MSTRFGWWKIGGFNLQAEYGFGSEREADAYCAKKNEGREINHYSPEFLGETNEEARAASGCQHLGDGDGFDFE